MEDLRSEQLMREVVNLINDDVDFLDAIEHYAFKHNIDIELLGEVIKRSKVLRGIARENAEKKNLVAKTNRLPI